MDKRDFLKAFSELERQYQGTRDNPGSYRCERCQHCRECMFSNDCTHCYKCTYCIKCQNCYSCTHCRECDDCHDSAYCLRCTRCTGSSYLVMSQDCAGCTFCFGCVGLVGKDFHILNKPYGRTEYFTIIASLKQEFGLPTR